MRERDACVVYSVQQASSLCERSTVRLDIVTSLTNREYVGMSNLNNHTWSSLVALIYYHTNSRAHHFTGRFSALVVS